MGEYAQYEGEEIKIGTCEDMYYLRADQARKVKALKGSVDPVRDAEAIRFRFPFPDEDRIAPGQFENAFRGVYVNVPVPEGVDHSKVQFKADVGYLMSVPCPEGAGKEHASKLVHKNGFAGSMKVVQQRLVNGKFVTVCQCGGCGAAFRLPTLADAQPVIDALRKQADQERFSEHVRPGSTPESSANAGKFYDQVADRIEAGYRI